MNTVHNDKSHFFSFQLRFRILLVVIGFSTSLSAQTIDFIRGADLSFLSQIEDSGGIYQDEAVNDDALNIFKNHGFNSIRLRVWHSPANGYSGLDDILEMAQRIHDLDLGLMLDFHYSDTWADPAHQTPPASWEGLSVTHMADSVYEYTAMVISALVQQGTTPDLIQLGNEISCGMLWDTGRVCGEFETEVQWQNLEQLISAGLGAVQETLPANHNSKIIIHYADGGSNSGCQWFFNNLFDQGLDFDVIGVSFYPWWHGTLTDLQTNLTDLSFRYAKEIMVVETAYPWTLDWYDYTNNNIGMESQLHPGYSASVEGQENFYRDLLRLVYDLPYNQGGGVFLWAPDWISTPGFGSGWENLALFDFTGNLLQSISAFEVGDINQDDVIDVVDIIQMISFILQDADQGLELWRADLNNDQNIDIIDIVAVVYLVLNP